MYAVSRSVHFATYRRRTGPRDPKHTDCADKVKPNDVADSSFRQPDWSFLKNVSQVAGFTGFNPIIEGPNRFFGIRDFPLMKFLVGITGLKNPSGEPHDTHKTYRSLT